eukprot:929916-Pyramimonas_sp.AAC.1
MPNRQMTRPTGALAGGLQGGSLQGGIVARGTFPGWHATCERGPLRPPLIPCERSDVIEG